MIASVITEAPGIITAARHTPSARRRRDAFAQVRDKDDLELYYKTIPDYFEQDDGRKLTEVPDRTSTDMIEGRY